MFKLSRFTESDFQRIRKTAERPPRVSVYDVMCAVTGATSCTVARTWKRLQKTYPEQTAGCHPFRFPTHGGNYTPVATVQDMTRIMTVLPGKATADVRQEAADALVRYLGLGQERNRLTPEDHPARFFSKSVESSPLEKTVADAVAAALANQVLEISGSSTANQQSLLAMGAKVDASNRDRIEAEGGPLHVSSFLTDSGVPADLVRRLTPVFSREVNRRKLAAWDAGLRGGPLWIAWSQGAWRLYHTEADRDVLWEVFSDPLTEQYLSRLRENDQRPTRPSASSSRAGPYSRPAGSIS